MERLRLWLRRRGFALEAKPGADDHVLLLAEGGGRVILDARQPLPVRLCRLLHECGHVAIDAKRRQGGWAARAPRRAGATLRELYVGAGRLRARRLACELAQLHEEIEAWEEGEGLARRLRLRLPRGRFERERVQALMTYVRSAARTRR